MSTFRRMTRPVAADQFSRYGILEEMELPRPADDRISAVTFEC